MDEVWFGITKTPQKSIEQAELAAEKSMELSPDLPPPHGLLSMISLLKRGYDDAVDHAEKAVDLSPNDPGGYFSLGLALRFAGRHEEAIKAMEPAFRLSPLRPLTWINTLAWAYAGNKQYDKAIQLWTEGIERNPDYLFAYQGLTVAYELSGNHEKARWAAENVMRINPSISIAALEKMDLMKDGDFRKRIFEAYRRAGIK
jgi:adenylate cyclase